MYYVDNVIAIVNGSAATNVHNAHTCHIFPWASASCHGLKYINKYGKIYRRDFKGNPEVPGFCFSCNA